MWFILLACVGDKNRLDDTSGAVDTAPSASDTAEPHEGETVPWLAPEAVWGSSDEGYTTGGALVDIDGDGDLELVAANGNDMAPGAVVVYDNRGDGLSDVPSWASDTAEYYGHLDVGDVNSDGWPDVVVSRFLGEDRFETPGGVDVFLNQGGELSATPSWTARGFFSFSCALGDMDGDGDLDLAVAVGEAYRNLPDHSLVFRNDGAGDFGPSAVWQTEVPRHSFDVAWADLNGDGVQDLAFANNGDGHTIYLGPIEDSGPPHWTASEGGFEGNTLDIGDVDGDGYLDLVVSDNNQLGGAGTVRMWCGPGYALCWTSQDPPQMQSAVSLEDVDLDGDLDLFAGAWWGALRMYENVDGQLSDDPVWWSSEPDTVIEALAWGDVNGDGLREVVVTNWTPDGPNLLYAR